VRRDPQQGLALPEVEPHQAEVQLFEVAQPTMHNPGRGRSSTAAEIPLFDQGDTEAPERRVAGHTAADDAATDHHDVERFTVETRNPAHVPLL
jgi:hypothetical protein